MTELANEPLFAGGPLVTVVRFLLCAAAGYNVLWSFRGVCDLFRQQHLVVAVLRTAIFLVCLGTFLLQILVLGMGENGSDSVFALACLLMLLAGHSLLSYYQITGLDKKVDRFFNFYPYIDKALPIVELAEIDPAKASEIHKLTIGLLVQRMLEQSPVAGTHDAPPKEPD